MENNDIKKALECCCGDIVECQKCAYVKNGYNRCKERASQDALALITSQEQRIGELTEENERLRADTVRKMLERIKEDAISVSLLSNPPKFMLEIREDALDQIAKEMLEGEK